MPGKISEKQQLILDYIKEEILKKYTHIDKLTIPIVQEFIDSIFISEVTKDGQRNITINIAI